MLEVNPWMIVATTVGPLGAAIAFFYGMSNWFRNRAKVGEKRVTLYDMMRATEVAKAVTTQNSWLKSMVKAQEENAREIAKLEPELQCEGCGYFHNLRRCPKCTRMKAPRVVGHVDDASSFDPPRPVAWVAGGSANITDTIANIREAIKNCPMPKRAVDMNILGMSSNAQNTFGDSLTRHNYKGY